VNDDLERMWKVVVVSYFKAISRLLPGGTEKTTKILSQVCEPRYEHGTSRIRSRTVDYLTMTFNEYGFHMSLRVNSDYFFKKHQPDGLCNGVSSVSHGLNSEILYRRAIRARASNC
jgi:hypothetical protein